ncbi:hypothetical protein ACQ86F_18495 [Streptomyces venezuelae ATCC 10712]
MTTTAQVAAFSLKPLSVLAAGIALEATSGSVTLAVIAVSSLAISLVFAGYGRRLSVSAAPAAAPTLVRPTPEEVTP